MRVERSEEQLFFTTVRIETETDDGIGTGTGFIFEYSIQENGTESHVLCLVTNKHVVRKAKIGRFWFITEKDGQPHVGNREMLEVPDFERHWHGHDDPDVDIAVMPIGGIIQRLQRDGKEPFFRSIGKQHVPTQEQLDDFNAIEPITFIGYPNGMFDEWNFTPVARRGFTATPPVLDYGGKPVFLIDASVFPGSSGSPVFVAGVSFRHREGALQFADRMVFVGVVSSVFVAPNIGDVRIVPVPTALKLLVTTDQMIDIGVVFKASTVVETVESLLRKHGKL